VSSPGAELAVTNGQSVNAGDILFSLPEKADERVPTPTSQGDSEAEQSQPITARVVGQIIAEDNHIYVRYEESEEREYSIPLGVDLLVQSGDKLKAGDKLTRGPVDPHDILRIMGKDAVQQ
ncbi:unnamed protein product, partial [marine sediment metagenome]